MSDHRAKKRQKRKRIVLNIMVSLVLITMICMIAGSAINIYMVRKNGSGSGESVQTEKISNEYINSYYSIGNNATAVNKTYFKELNSALDEGNDENISSSLVKCFVTEYYTWTNKDGNYDVGGMQYIYTARQSDFSTYSRDHFYSVMDNYLSSNDRSSLIEVTEVTIDSVSSNGEYTVLDENGNSISYPSYLVHASWTYADSVMDTASIQSSGDFTVINHDGRMEIAAIA